MPTQDRLLLSLAGISGCVSVWLVFQSLTQWTLQPTTSPSNVVFLMVVTSTIVIILLTKKVAAPEGRKTGRVRVNRGPLMIFGSLAAILLAAFSLVFEQVKDPGSESIVLPAEASLAGFAGLGILLVLFRLMWQRMREEPEIELAPGPTGGPPVV